MWKYGGEKHISHLVGKYQGKRPFGRPKHRSDACSTMVLKETRLEDVDWFNLAQNRHNWLALLNMVMNRGSHKIQRVSTLG